MDTLTERWNLLWAAQRSARYHARRQAFFDRWRRVTLGFGVIFGSAAAVDLLKGGIHDIAIFAAFIVAIMSAVDMVVGTADMAWQHRELRKRFLMLESAIRCSTDAPAETEIHRWLAERLAIESDEPPIYVGLDLLCENEMARAHAMPPRSALPFWAAMTAQWLRWENLAPKPGSHAA
jgi:hypothetical protein